MKILPNLKTALTINVMVDDKPEPILNAKYSDLITKILLNYPPADGGTLFKREENKQRDAIEAACDGAPKEIFLEHADAAHLRKLVEKGLPYRHKDATAFMDAVINMKEYIVDKKPKK